MEVFYTRHREVLCETPKRRLLISVRDDVNRCRWNMATTER